jgi:hypothetical protein
VGGPKANARQLDETSDRLLESDERSEHELAGSDVGGEGANGVRARCRDPEGLDASVRQNVGSREGVGQLSAPV